MPQITDLIHGQATDVSADTATLALTQRWALPDAKDFKNDFDVLNYALTLEYLEAEFYRQGNAHHLLTGVEAGYLRQVAADEAYHVRFLASAIKAAGGKPVSKPCVDFGKAFASRTSYLTYSHTFENTGVGAYLGAAGYIKDKTYLQAAAGIFGVEARHAAVVGELLGLAPEGGVYMGPFEKPLTKATVLAAVKPFLVDCSGS